MLEKLVAKRGELLKKRDEIRAGVERGRDALNQIAGALAALDEVEKELKAPGFKVAE